MTCKCPSRETFDIEPLGSGTKCGITVKMTRANIPKHDCWITVTAPWGVVTTDERVYVGDSKKYNDGDDYDYIKVWFMRVQDWKYRFGVCYKKTPPDLGEGKIIAHNINKLPCPNCGSAEEGEEIEVIMEMKNIGEEEGEFRFYIYDQDGNELSREPDYTYKNVEAGDTWRVIKTLTTNLNFDMIDKTLNGKVKLVRQT